MPLKRISLTFSSNDACWINHHTLPFGHEVSTEVTEGSNDTSVVAAKEKILQAKQRQVMGLAQAPGKSLFTTALMLWMSGSNLHIFSIMSTGMALINPIKGILSINQTFDKFNTKEDPVDLKIPKLIFIALQLLTIGMALYKCSTMGLLPLTSSDWTVYIPPKVFLESSAVPQ